MQQFSSENDNLPLSRFELMLKTNSVYFFDADEFEQIILHYVDTGKISLANKALNLGLQQHPASVSLKLIRVELLILDENIEEADTILNELQEFEPTNDEIYIQKATIYSKKGLHKKAIEVLKMALQYAEDEIEIYSMIGMEYLFIDDFETARLNFAKCLDVEYDNYSSLYNVIYCYEMMDQHKEAIQYLLLHIDKDPYSEVAWHQLGRQYVYIEDYKKALEAFDYAILIDDTFIGAHLEKAKTLENLERYEEAIVYYHLTMEIDTPTPFVYLRIGKCFEKLNDKEKALEFYDKTVKEDPLLDKGWLALTDIYISEKKYPKALFYIKKAINIDEENNDYWNKLAEINLRMNLYEEAVRAYQRSIHLKDEKLETFIALSGILHFLGKFSKAIQVLKKGEEIFQDNAEILYRLSGINYISGNEEEAIVLLEKALKINYDYYPVIEDVFPTFFSDPRVISLLEKFKK